MVAPKSRFRPCIDLHDGQVKQIVGGTLSDTSPDALRTNFVARLVLSGPQSPAEFAKLYKDHHLEGGHVIKLGPGNDDAAREALSAWPGRVSHGYQPVALFMSHSGGLQIGGEINDINAQQWLDAGASKVIVTSYLFPGAKFSLERLKRIFHAVGKDRLVVDVSCRRRDSKWLIAMNKWQDITDMEVSQENLDLLSDYCSEFLIHAADVEGLCQGIDKELVSCLGDWVKIPTTYAGGAKDIDDLDLVNRLSGGRVDLTYGRYAKQCCSDLLQLKTFSFSALDIFGGSLVKFEELVKIIISN
ncbi:hypothetical protein EDD18DRAFT_1260050 [Armillaria luteobubalina]|uniref:1-(5-phosphoribosyl)-5-[(5-phosphoribosylamino)methylideneamino] imidazole-4-carboxamide isomerase n=1 Tax=Armillaria luteobubalina TaxID=153913 RepID=A0AA39PN81_9AGAR|nr:hypothetical protein EDD18DRAFT_1260050 [Armillaria luteobubalina]